MRTSHSHLSCRSDLVHGVEPYFPTIRSASPASPRTAGNIRSGLRTPSESRRRRAKHATLPLANPTCETGCCQKRLPNVRHRPQRLCRLEYRQRRTPTCWRCDAVGRPCLRAALSAPSSGRPAAVSPRPHPWLRQPRVRCVALSSPNILAHRRCCPTSPKQEDTFPGVSATRQRRRRSIAFVEVDDPLQHAWFAGHLPCSLR